MTGLLDRVPGHLDWPHKEGNPFLLHIVKVTGSTDGLNVNFLNVLEFGNFNAFTLWNSGLSSSLYQGHLGNIKCFHRLAPTQGNTIYCMNDGHLFFQIFHSSYLSTHTLICELSLSIRNVIWVTSDTLSIVDITELLLWNLWEGLSLRTEGLLHIAPEGP